MKFLLRFTFLLLLSAQSAAAQLGVSKVFTDNMVLQKDHPIQFLGKGVPGSDLKIQFGREIKKTAIAQDSTWFILFKKQQANVEPQSIQITSNKEQITLKNVLVGDIWLCLGQSNMEWPLEKELHFAAEVKNTNQPLLRFYNPTYAGKNIYNEAFKDSVLKLLNKENFYKGKWEVSNSESIKKMSAVGYYFGKEILTKEGIPIGLINLAIGGAPIETFIRREAMESNAQFSKKLHEKWLSNNDLPDWIRERGQQNVGNIAVIYENELGPNHAFKPGFAYDSSIELLKLPIKGILWYQGESNAQEMDRVNEYGKLQKLMIEDYRLQLKQPKLPFYWVQLSSIDSVKYKSQYWPQFRNEQRKLMSEVTFGGMAVSSDIGAKNNVHPTNKKDVGQRLARWALYNTYGHDVIPSGPLPIKATFTNGIITIAFEYVAKGFQTSDNKNIRGFSLDGKQEIPAIIKDDTIEIKSQKKPEFVYYSWQPFAIGNLENNEGLPASTFKIRIQ